MESITAETASLQGRLTRRGCPPVRSAVLSQTSTLHMQVPPAHSPAHSLAVTPCPGPVPRCLGSSSSRCSPARSLGSTSSCHAAISMERGVEEDLVWERTIEEAERDMAVSTEDYNQQMKRAMANPYEYHHHLGMYYTRILPKLIVGSQPQSVDDISKLHHEEGVGVVLNLQQDHDIAYWGIDIHPIRQRCEHHGMQHHRRPVVDFDPHSLRNNLPRMVSVIEHNISAGKTVYVHCTAGLGRAPASAIAYLFWFQSMDLKKAYDFLTSKRPCGPKWDAIRGATYDLALNNPHKIPLEHLPGCAFSDVSQWERDLIQLRVRQMYHH